MIEIGKADEKDISLKVFLKKQLYFT